jgi:hypothetical protein
MTRLFSDKVALPEFRAAVADAVHAAVVALTGDDGYGHCELYALAGTLLLRQLTGENYQPQVGSFLFRADPAGNAWFEINAAKGGLDRFEYHAWIGLPGPLLERAAAPGEPHHYGIGALIDLSTRHLRKMVERMPQVESAQTEGDFVIMHLREPADRIRWTREDEPPQYLWVDEIPNDFRYDVDQEATRGFYERGMLPREALAQLAAAVHEEFLNQWAFRAPSPAAENGDKADGDSVLADLPFSLPAGPIKLRPAIVPGPRRRRPDLTKLRKQKRRRR